MPGKVTDDPSRSRRGPRTEPPANAAADACEPDEPGVRRLYTAGLMADVLGAPPAAVRHCVRTGLLEPTRRAGSIEWFGFGQLVVGQRLAPHLSDRRLRQEILAIDGATILDHNGQILAAGAILKVPGGSSGGGRRAAAVALAALGVGIKVSADGGIEGFRRSTGAAEEEQAEKQAGSRMSFRLMK